MKNRTHYEYNIIHDEVTEIISGGTTLPTGYGTLPTAFCSQSDIKMPDGKYIRITLGNETLTLTSIPAKTDRVYRETIVMNNGVSVRVQLTNMTPEGKGDRNRYYYNAVPLSTTAITPYIGQTYTVKLVSDAISCLDEKYIPDTIQRTEEGKGLSTNDLTDELKANYDAAYEFSQAEHAPVDAQANVIEKITVNGTEQTITDKTVDITIDGYTLPAAGAELGGVKSGGDVTITEGIINVNLTDYATEEYVNRAVAPKAQVQIITWEDND